MLPIVYAAYADNSNACVVVKDCFTVFVTCSEKGIYHLAQNCSFEMCVNS